MKTVKLFICGWLLFCFSVSVIAANQPCADPVSANSANFTMLNPQGFNMGADGGTNDVVFSWNGTAFTASSDYTGPGSPTNVTLSSADPFFGAQWIAHDIQLFSPGSYFFETSLGGGAAETSDLNVTVGPGQLGLHMLFDWGPPSPTICGVSNCNIDVFVLVNLNSVFGVGIARSTTFDAVTEEFDCDGSGSTPIKNCLLDGQSWGPAGRPAGTKEWMFASADGDSDGVMGVRMPAGGPFPNFSANFNFPGNFTNPTGVCGGFQDLTPDNFSFATQTDAALSTLYESNSITVTGLGVNQSIPNPNITANVTITNGEYSKNGGAYTSIAGTATNGDTFKVRSVSPGADNQSINVILNIGNGNGIFAILTPVIQGAQGSNFTMLDPSGGLTGGTNDVVATWDNSCETNTASTVFSAMSLASIEPFFQYTWSAHHIRVFCEGSYTINVDCTVNQLEMGACAPNPDNSRNMSFVVGPGQVGAHMLFNWHTHSNIDVVNVWNRNEVFGPSRMHTGAGTCNSALTIWSLMSTDWDGDGTNGGKMIDGAFEQFSANFNLRLSGNPLPCGAYTPTVNVSDPSGMPGCSMTTQKQMKQADWWLILAFLMALKRRHWTMRFNAARFPFIPDTQIRAANTGPSFFN